MITVVYQNSDFIVINKPCGVGMHRTAVDDKTVPSLVDLLCLQEKIDQLYLIHRLDTPTSGTMILAKNKKTAQSLNLQFLNHEITKYYLCLLSKKPKKKQGKIQGLMTKTRNGSYKLIPSETTNHNATSTSSSAQQNAVTLFFTYPYPLSRQLQESFDHKEANFNFPARLALIKPLTGKTHQIRVAFKAMGAPILGDTRYKGANADRLYLHSMYLSFRLNDELYEFETFPEFGQFFDNALMTRFPNPNSINWPAHTIPK